ncbi:hypothetical protein V1512DRAFT_271303 [Lipomyces arxii]|uniref:uncharacterized protein n=1 Tax=Lipomyces arxii TaxID=56418 RepID=UPI0034CEB4CA
MGDQKPFYGGGSTTDATDQAWDMEALARQGRERAERERQARESRFQRAVTPPDAHEIEIRRQRLNLDQDLNQVVVVPAGASAVGKKGRGAGYYCEVCDLTYKDSLQWLDHLNSKQHLRASGQTETQVRATVDDVRNRLAWLRQKRDAANNGQEYDIKQRIAERKRIEEDERRMRREKRMQRRKVKKSGVRSGDDEEGKGNEEDGDRKAMEEMMGIRNFGTTKVN